MKKVEAIIEPAKLEEVKEALALVGVDRMNVTEIHGFGREKRHTEALSGKDYEVSFMRRTKLAIVVNDDFVETLIDTIIKSARTGVSGKVGDGKIFVLPIDECIRIRTGERDKDAV